ncbi:unnamed protein product [Calicophoron daubneyi]|uniref:Kinesin-associated protein 3 n=1 Tax=Calicophoron daubneyi TaxID=300641 RepID=A0AAV2TP87_CALDB
MNDDAKFLKRKIRGGSIDVHPTEKAIVVHYETEATILGEMGNPMVGDRKESQKIIRVKNLNENTNIPELARKIVDSCQLISESKIPQVEHLLKYLLGRKETGGAKALKSASAGEKLADPGAFDSTEIDEVAHLTDVDEYLELLYEDLPDKLRASALILQLARNPDNLEELFQNETLVGALARVLREDWKKSTDLATNITYIFFCFSSFSNFHGVIIHFKIGALTMSVVEHELQKYELWIQELEKKKSTLNTNLSKTDDLGAVEEAKKSYETSSAKFESLIRKQEQLFRVSFYLLLNISEDLNVEVKMHHKGIVSLISRCLNRNNFELLILLVSFLKKLSIFVENKDEMLRNKVIEHVIKLLDRPEDELINITLRLLFNLSFDTNARLEMVSRGLINTLVGLLDNELHRPIALYILYHLSTEDKSKAAFAETDCLPALMKICLERQDEMTELVPMALAINLACDPSCAIRLGEKKGIRILMKRAIKMRDPLIMKLLRNISLHDDELKMKFVDYLPELVKIVTSGVKTKRSIQSAKNLRQPEDLEIIRLRSSSRNQNRSLGDDADAVHDLPEFANMQLDKKLRLFDQGDMRASDDQDDADAKDEDFVLESLGCLANLKLKDLDYSRVLKELNLLDWIKTQLAKITRPATSRRGFKPYSAGSHSLFEVNIEDDELLEIIRLINTVCLDREGARLIVDAKIVDNLVDLLNAKQEDDEIVCQVIHVFYMLVYHEKTRETVIKSTQAPAYLIDLMHDKNAEIRRICDVALDIIAESDSNWGNRIQADRFRWYNSQWLEMIGPPSDFSSIGNDPTTDAVMAAALAAGRGRSQYRRGSVSGDYQSAVDSDKELDEAAGPFGVGAGIDDAKAFLMSIPPNFGMLGGTPEGETALGLGIEDTDYLKQLELLYPEIYGDSHVLRGDTLSPALSVSSASGSDPDLTPPATKIKFGTLA